MNILIIGASGFVGKALSQQLVLTKNKIFLASKERGQKIPGTKSYLGDVSNAAFCRKILKNVHTVYYLAAKRKNIFFHTKEPFDYISQNVVPLVTFLEQVKKSKVKKVVYMSSTIVEYASFKDSIDGYVLGKYICERIIQAFAKQYPNIDITVIRSAAIYGPGDNFHPKTAPFIPAIIDRVHHSKDAFEVWGQGKRKLQYIYIDDLIKNLVTAGKKKDIPMVSIGNAQQLSVEQIVKKIIVRSGKNLKIVYDKTKPDKQTQLVKFNNLIKPKVNFDKGLKKTIEYYQEISNKR